MLTRDEIALLAGEIVDACDMAIMPKIQRLAEQALAAIDLEKRLTAPVEGVLTVAEIDKAAELVDFYQYPLPERARLAKVFRQAMVASDLLSAAQADGEDMADLPELETLADTFLAAMEQGDVAAILDAEWHARWRPTPGVVKQLLADRRGLRIQWRTQTERAARAEATIEELELSIELAKDVESDLQEAERELAEWRARAREAEAKLPSQECDHCFGEGRYSLSNGASTKCTTCDGTGRVPLKE